MFTHERNLYDFRDQLVRRQICKSCRGIVHEQRGRLTLESGGESTTRGMLVGNKSPRSVCSTSLVLLRLHRNSPKLQNIY